MWERTVMWLIEIVTCVSPGGGSSLFFYFPSGWLRRWGKGGDFLLGLPPI